MTTLARRVLVGVVLAALAGGICAGCDRFVDLAVPDASLGKPDAGDPIPDAGVPDDGGIGDAQVDDSFPDTIIGDAAVD